MTSLGRLTRVDLRAEWSTEDRDFTPWLAREDNIKLLGETLGMDLEVEAEEKRVGRFSADILAKNLDDSDAWVVIENQLERTDHSHLGQILTYAAGLEAKTCIWIAAHFHEEHRAAIDWLNEITSDDHQFFALEIELWRIGDSMAAPKFNVVAQPNDWKRDIGRSVKSAQPAQLTKTKALQLEFWTALRERLNGHRFLRSQKPSPNHWTNFSIGRSGLHLAATTNSTKNLVGVELYMPDTNAKVFFKQLEDEQEQIDMEIGLTLDWQFLPTKRACRIITTHPMTDLENKADWPGLQSWITDALERFHTCFAPKVKSLSVEGLN